ncbi:MAG: hypothetical protein U9N44_03905 [Chloroflexota bacterium]|nr:hypothetical protein [Chloroflexota bacterium]
MQLLRKYTLYLLRWQLSTPILAVCVVGFASLGTTWSTVLANLFGGLLFFWVDRWIFRKTDILRGEVWEIQQDIACADCGGVADRGYRLVKASHYDKSNDKKPEFRCQTCSQSKYEHDRGKPGTGATPPIGTG